MAGQGATAAEPPPQELAGPARPPRPANRQPSMHPAMAETPAPLPPIRFLAGSARLTPSATRILDSLSGRFSGGTLRVEAHAASDRDLADRRARAVVGYLAQNCGVDAALVEVVLATGGDGQVLVEDMGS